MSSVTAALSPPESLARGLRKRKLAEDPESLPAHKKDKREYTDAQETYIATQIMDPIAFSALYGAAATYKGQSLNYKFYKQFTEVFNAKFRTNFNFLSLKNKFNDMRMRWRDAHHLKDTMRREEGLTLQELEDRMKEHCHYYVILEPALVNADPERKLAALGSLKAIGRRLPERSSLRLVKKATEKDQADPPQEHPSTLDVTKETTEKKQVDPPREQPSILEVAKKAAEKKQVDPPREQPSTLGVAKKVTGKGPIRPRGRPPITRVLVDESDHDDEVDVHGGQTRSNTGESRTLAVRAERFIVRQPQTNMENATTPQAPPNEMDILSMLKDIKDTSKLQCEAEKEQTRREQLQFEERARAQQETIRLERLRIEEARLREEETTKREQLRVEEARLRVEETRLREEETTKREAIRAEVEKAKDQIRMKELEIEHTSKLLQLEEARTKRAVAERKNLQTMKTRESTGSVEHPLETTH
ncbi:hypothetical protein BGX34_008303 [Mortierella sp. NVP85]|nr:hypothetical protein BGX34_008303 [Mortierella sp. NVP85]